MKKCPQAFAGQFGTGASESFDHIDLNFDRAYGVVRNSVEQRPCRGLRAVGGGQHGPARVAC